MVVIPTEETRCSLGIHGRPCRRCSDRDLLCAGEWRGVRTGQRLARLDAVRTRGELLCGTGGEIPGFSMVDSSGVMRGLDADYCRAVAAAVLGDANKVKWVPVTAQTRFTALQSG